MILLLALGCGGPVQSASALPLEDYAGLDEGRAWTWRDDADRSVPPDATTLLHGQLDDSGIALRRGDRWEDATDAGRIDLSLSDDIVLDGWSVDGDGDDTSLLLVQAGAEDGAVATADGHSCTVTRPDPYTTWYATFDPVITVDCDTGLSIVLAKGFGVVALTEGDVSLELVAPY